VVLRTLHGNQCIRHHKKLVIGTEHLHHGGTHPIPSSSHGDALTFAPPSFPPLCSSFHSSTTTNTPWYFTSHMILPMHANPRPPLKETIGISASLAAHLGSQNGNPATARHFSYSSKPLRRRKNSVRCPLSRPLQKQGEAVTQTGADKGKTKKARKPGFFLGGGGEDAPRPGFFA
jgi:hypothetical protein